MEMLRLLTNNKKPKSQFARFINIDKWNCLGVQENIFPLRTCMKAISILVLLPCALASGEALAQSTICTIPGQTLGATVLAWDSDTKIAKFTDEFNDTYVGTVVLIRPHDQGYKVNLHFDFGKDHYGVDSVEFIVFPIPDKFRVIGAGFATINGQKYLTQSYGTNDATCVSL